MSAIENEGIIIGELMGEKKFLKHITYTPKDGLVLDAKCGNCQYADYPYEYTSEVVC